MNRREYSFDIMRIIAMILVVIIHVSNVYSRSFGMISNESFLTSLLFNTVARISVPIFFMISGALLLDRKFDKRKYIKRLLRFAFIIAVWDFIYIIWEYFYLGLTYNKFYLLFFDPFRAHLWFLYSIIVLYFVQPLLKLILDKSNKFIKILLLLVWIIFSTLSMFNSSIASIFTIFNYIGYFVIGKYLYNYVKKVDLSKYNIVFVILIVLSIIGSTILNYYASIKFSMFYNIFFAYRTPFIMVASLSTFILIYNLFHNKKPNKVVMTLSDLSFGVYLIHGIFLDVTTKNVNYVPIDSALGIPLFTIFILVCSLACCFLIKKTIILKRII